MNSSKYFRSLLLVFASIATSCVSANDAFWVLGSFETESTAQEEAARITAQSGVEVRVQYAAANGRYRVVTLLLDDPSEQDLLRTQLARAGVSDVWTWRQDTEEAAESLTVASLPESYSDYPGLTDDLPADLYSDDLDEAELAEIDALLADFDDEFSDELMDGYDEYDVRPMTGSSGPTVNYVVAGSFRDMDAAQQAADALSDSEFGVTVSDGPSYRVLVGPVDAGSEADTVRSLTAMGIAGVWVLRGAPAPAGSRTEQSAPVRDRSQELGNPLRGLKIPGREPVYGGVRKPASESDFNLARLKRKAD